MSLVIKTTMKPYNVPVGERTIRELLGEIHKCIKDLVESAEHNHHVVTVDDIKFYLNLENIDGMTDEIEKKLGLE